MSLPDGLYKYRGKLQNSSDDAADRLVYTRFYTLAAGKGLGDITGLERGDLMPDETDKYIMDVGIVSDKNAVAEIVKLTGYKPKVFA